MAKVYAYNVQDNDFQFFNSETEWEKQITVLGIKRYLTDHVRQQLVREVPIAIKTFKITSCITGVGRGYWALVRMILSPVSYLGSLHVGKDTTDSAIEFLEEYIGRKQNLESYLDLSALIFVMFRHGLIHTSMPKIIERDDGMIIGWEVSFNSKDHLTKKIESNSLNLVLSPEQLYKDLLKGIELYVNDFDGPRQASLIDAFKKGHLLMATINTASELQVNTLVQQKIRHALNTL